MYDFKPEKPLRLVYGTFNLAILLLFTGPSKSIYYNFAKALIFLYDICFGVNRKGLIQVWIL
jgi:hypothetical protein